MLPSTMLAAVRSRYGGPEAIELRTVDVPRPEAGQVLVRVRAASLNQVDHYLLRGSPLLSRLSGGLRRPKETGLGHDFAGDVVAAGANVTDPKVGDAVFGSGIRAFAEYVAVKAEGVVAKPVGVSYHVAAAVPVAGITALQGLRRHGALQTGQRVLVTGAGGGVGGFGARIAKALGAEVTATTREWNLERVRAMGVDRVFDSAGRRGDADALAVPNRYDLVLDVAGDRSVAALARATRPNGAIVIVGAWRISMVRIIGWILEARIGSRVRGRRIVFFYSQRDQADLETLRDLLAAGSITPDIEKTYPLVEIADAVRHLETFRTQGKVVVTTC
jgi:NADPH:quinone reductase-like Zn-dependent oxidoreductase